MTTEAMTRPFTFTLRSPRKGEIADLHGALAKIGLAIAPGEVDSGRIGPTTIAGIEMVQKRAGLPITGKVNAKTVAAIRAELGHQFYAGSKKRTAELQAMLGRLGHPVDAGETKARRYGASTEASVEAFAAAAGVPFDNGRLSDTLVAELRAKALTAQFTSKTQIAALQRLIGRVDRIAKLNTPISADELKARAIGATTETAIRAVQQKYGLPVTGQLDPPTYERLVSVAASRPAPKAVLRVTSTEGLAPIPKTLRLNQKSERVAGLQRALAFLGHPIDQKEFATRTYGKTTRAAVLAYQKAAGLPLTGQLENATKARLNADLARVLPPAAATAPATYLVRGSVRDALWNGKAGVRVQAWETALRGDGTLLAERKTAANGFFNIPYAPPRDPVDGTVKKPFELQVRVLGPDGAQTAAKVTLNPSPTVWVNFTDGPQPYLGTSEWETELAAIAAAAGGVAVADLHETAEDKELTYVALHSGLDVEEVMRVVLSHLVAAELAVPVLTPDAVYAFVGQSYPSSLPGDLVESTAAWTLIDQLVDQTAQGLVFLDDVSQAEAFAQAVAANLIPVATGANRAAILAALAAKRQTFALEKPILVGNGTLQSLLAATPGLPAASYPLVADAFLANRGLGDAFWESLSSSAADFGGQPVVDSLHATAQLGAIAKHHEPTFTFLQAQIANPANTELTNVSDTATLTTDQWQALIVANGSQVPDGLPGDTPAERIAYFATSLQQQAERLFPTHALAARAAGSDDHSLTQLTQVQQLLQQHPALDLAKTNVAAFAKTTGVVLDPGVASELKVLQRVQRITGDAAAGAALLDEGLHHSAQIVYLGKERFTQAVVGRNVPLETARTAFSRAELQYAQVLARLGEYRGELHVGDPAAIPRQTYTPDEQQTLVGDVPDLEALFGSMDFCTCSTCQSLYGPGAYLSDALRFVDSHLSQQPPKTVREVLFDRRPDIGNIKLNCPNTETPLPYIDLVCEILEAAVPAPGADPDFSFQTTRSAAELRAFPENVRTAAYDVLRSADYPLDTVFDLWQQEARVWLAHLGVPRWQLMAWLQSRPAAGDPAPADASIAGEYLGLSSHETSLITEEATDAARQTALWGLDATQASVGVEDFLAHSKLDYAGLLQLVQVQWIDAGGDPPVAIARTSSSGDLSFQTVENLTPARFDRIHRFLRLWRRAGWQMWELDLLIRAEGLGQGTLDGTALARLQAAKQVQARLRVDVDELLAFYGDLNTETRTQPGDPAATIDPYYATLFQNARVTDPVDPALALPLAAGAQLADHRAAVSTALAISEADFDLVVARPNAGALTLANLSRMVATVTLARSLGLTIERLLVLQDLSTVADVFATPQDTLDFLELHDRVVQSGFTVDELDYLLSFRPDSPYGLRDDVVAQLAGQMRDARRAAAPPDEQDAIATAVASAIGVTKTQAQVLLTGVQLDAKTLLAILSDPALVARTVVDGLETYANDVTAGAFPDVFAAYRLLQKIALVLSRQKLASVDDLTWLLARHAAFGLLDLAALPVTADPAASLFPSWLALTKWLDFHARYPEPEDVTLRGVYDAADALDPTLFAQLATLTAWPEADIDTIAATLGLSYAADANDWLSPDTYLRVERAAKAVKRLGVAAATAVPWADRDDDGGQAATAQQTRGAAKAKYDTDTWLAKAAPLYDTIREQKRDGLVSYLIETARRTAPPTVTVGGNEYANPACWRDPDDLLRYFCIDVEMGSAQLTSRIKQAISSVQMFVQRCFLNLEQPYVQVGEAEKADAVTLNSWRQWETMKSYAAWVAARQVFFYPENWLEPELRDDKTPFFEELEAEIQQSDMTAANAETAIRHYLEKVHEVSRLVVLGAYHEVDDDVSDGGPTVDVLHVVARTKTDPALHYYRRYDFGYGTWSPWEKIDVDIAGEHLLPVVYNRKLWLFWLVVNERPQKVKKQPKAQPSTVPTDAPAPPKQLEIQLAWSHRTPDGWVAKKVSKEAFVHPWERPVSSYHLKSRYKSRENLLWLDLYVSTSPEFNASMFYDPFKDALVRATAAGFDETGRPWHSSSFVFDGGVTALKMKPLRAFYHLVDGTGQQGDSAVYSDSFQFVRGAFGEPTRELLPLQGPYEIAPRLPLPDGMHYRFNRLANNVRNPNASKLNVLELSNTRTVAQGAKAPFEVVFSQDQIRFDTAEWGAEPFLYQDRQRSFFVKTAWEPVQLGYNQTVQRLQYDFFPFYHPYTELFVRELDRSGVTGVLNRRIQRFPGGYFPGNAFDFSSSYAPVAPNAADATAEHDVVDFALSGAYATYNWEIFFHIPLLIATRLGQNQRFEEAMSWFHTIFDPTNVDELSSPQRYWVTRPFFEMSSDEYRKERIENLLADLGANLDQLRAWKNDPFNPHKIARYRPVAYQKNVVMKYIDNLIAWGDQLFGQDTLESINQATLLYALAQELLGPRPQLVPPVPHDEYSWNELVAHGELDPLGNESVPAQIENLTPPPAGNDGGDGNGPQLPVLDPLYFAIPANDKLLGYWDTVADRLFKIRHSLNIQGVFRQLPLFEPPLDPALLVKAAAYGVDLGSILTLGSVDTGPYRYRTLLTAALDFANEVSGLGEKLLSALEKQDAESLELLKSANEIALLQAQKTIKQNEIAQAAAEEAALEQTLASAQAKSDYYGSRDFMNAWEITSLSLASASALSQTAIAVGYALAGGLKLIPNFVIGASGFGGSPVASAQEGGQNIGESAENAVKTLTAISGALDKFSSLATTMGSYARRKDDWDFQKSLADIDVQNATQQIAAAQIKQAIAQEESDDLDLQIQQSQAVDDFMHAKYTNQQLYGWMVGQISTVYFQAYQLAFDMARRAQLALQVELGRDDLSFITFGYWDSLKKGLLAADRLAADLRRMESAYYASNTRDLELTKHVSLAQVMPLSLLALRDSGQCTVQLPEWLFDMDFPGHYRRRITSVAMTVPAVVGPYSGVHATLTLTRNAVRVAPGLDGQPYGDPLTADPGDTRFATGHVACDSIATSHGQNDNGMFELSFSDERYFPFEGAGAVSEWTISMPKTANAFDFSTISDVILHVRYTAQPGDAELAAAAADNLAAVLPTSGMRLFALKNEFSDAWARFLNPPADTDQTLTVTLQAEQFPFFTRGTAIEVAGVDLFVDRPGNGAYAVKVAPPGVALPGATTDANPDPAFGNAPHYHAAVAPPSAATGDWTIQIRTGDAADLRSLTADEISNAYLVVHFQTS
jgi:peptidoglycan hydrolase-like protein with peptidoglycan-binding domain